MTKNLQVSSILHSLLRERYHERRLRGLAHKSMGADLDELLERAFDHPLSVELEATKEREMQ